MKRDLALLYLLTAWPLVLLQIVLTPPFQMPDEPHHFMRALQVANGQFGGQRFSDTLAGGCIEANAQSVATAFKALAHDLGGRFQTAELVRVASLRWGDSLKSPADFDNTAIYPPTLYLPTALAVNVGRASGFTILETYYLARFIVGSLGVGMAALSIAWCRRGRVTLFLLLSLPLTLSTFASVSQDAMSIACGSLAIAGLSFFIEARREMPAWVRSGIALLLGAVVSGRLPLIPLMGLALLPTGQAPGRATLWRRAAAASAGILPIGLALWCASVAKIAFRAGDGVSPPDQAAFLLHHPAVAAGVLATTLALLGGAFLREFVSVLGWWNGMRPAWYYEFVAIALALSVFADGRSTAPSIGWRAALLIIGAVLSAVLCVLLVMYVAWTPVGSAFVDGVQGRYFFVPAAACVLALARLDRGLAERDRSRWHDRALLLPCVALAGVNLLAVPLTILNRYYI